MLFGDLRDNAVDATKRQRIVDRLDLMEEGQWGTAWGQIQQAQAHDADIRPEMNTRMNKVKTLLEAGEISRAAQAVWGRAQAVEGREVRAAFEKNQIWRISSRLLYL